MRTLGLKLRDGGNPPLVIFGQQQDENQGIMPIFRLESFSLTPAGVFENFRLFPDKLARY